MFGNKTIYFRTGFYLELSACFYCTQHLVSFNHKTIKRVRNRGIDILHLLNMKRVKQIAVACLPRFKHMFILNPFHASLIAAL